MTADAALRPVNERGPLRGFANLLAKETGAWWRTRSWIVQTVIWLLILNGLTATLLWAAPDQAAGAAGADDGSVGALMNTRAGSALFIFFLMSGIAPVVGAVIIGQDALIAEKQSGTAAWVLSKPVSRSAFILAKLVGEGQGMLVTMVLIQGLIAYGQLAAAGGAPQPLAFLGGLGLVYLNLLFYFTLTLMLGALFNSRGPVIGLSLALLFGYQLFLGVAPWLAQIMPWAISTGYGANTIPLSVLVVLQQPLPTYGPLIATAAWCVLFVAVALWRFQREEF